LEGRAGTWDLLAGAPPLRAEVALLLKAIPCLEQLDKGLGPRLLEAVDAPVIVLSYPLRSLGGRAKGMAETYARHFAALATGQPWRVTRFDFPTELVYRIER
jgi:16S rRNA (guanine(1405)-N(7))-methyltransferase